MRSIGFAVSGTSSVYTMLALAVAALPCYAGIFGDRAVPSWALEAARQETPASAHDASQVILYQEIVETIDGNGRAVERIREARRILKVKGRDAGCTVGYSEDEKINYLRAWTIGADGKNYIAKDTDVADKGLTGNAIQLSSYNVRIAIPPAIDVGAVLVCESEEAIAPYEQEKTWSFQDEVPVLFAALEVDLPAGRAFTSSWHRHDAMKPIEVSSNHWRWELKDIPALNLEEIASAPSWSALAGRMNVQWGDAAVTDVDKQWRVLGRWFTDLEADRPKPSPEITAEVQSLTQNTPDFYTRLSRITAFIQKNVRYFIVERGLGGMRANFAQDVYQHRYGDCKDKTTLLIAMSQVAGIKAYYLAVDSHRGFVDPNLPSISGNHMITAIEIPQGVKDDRLRAVVTAKNGKRYLLFDPTDERTPFGTLPSGLQGGYGLLCAGEDSQVLALPVLSVDSNTSERKGTFQLAADGALTGSLDVLRTGTSGADQRLFVKYSSDKERREAVEHSVDHDIPGVVMNAVRFVEPEDLEKPMELHYTLTAAQYAHMAGQMMLVRPRVLASYVQLTDAKQRVYPVDLGSVGTWHDSYDIQIPAGFVVDEMPDPVDIDLPLVSYHSRVSAKENQLHYEREYVVRGLEIPASDFSSFYRLEKAILGDEKGTTVLRRK